MTCRNEAVSAESNNIWGFPSSCLQEPREPEVGAHFPGHFEPRGLGAVEKYVLTSSAEFCAHLLGPQEWAPHFHPSGTGVHCVGFVDGNEK